MADSPQLLPAPTGPDLSLLAAVGDAAHALPPSGVALLDVDMHECSPAPLLPPPSPSGVMALKMGTAASLAGPAQPLPTAGAPRAQQREPAVAKPPQPQQLEQRQPHVPPHLQQAPPQQQAAPPPQLQPQPQQQPQQRPPAPALPLPLQQQLPGGVGGVAGGLVVGGAVPEGLSRLDREAALTMLHFIGKYKEADPFRVPVDVVALDIPDYNDVITTPMDLRTVRDKVRQGQYRSMAEYRADMRLIWDNCRKYNGPEHHITKLADKLAAAFERRMDEAYAAARQALAAVDRSDGPKSRRHGSKAGGRSGGDSSGSESGDELEGLAGVSTGRVGNGALSGGGEQASPGGRPALKRSLTGEALDAGGNGAKAGVRRKLSSSDVGGAGPVDMAALQALAGTPDGRQLGADPEELAFLVLWKRLVARRKQLEGATAESEPLRRANTQLRATLGGAEDMVKTLQRQVREREAARVAEAAARAAAEERARDLARKLSALQAQHAQQQGMLENQRKLLEQQQAVLRKLARHSGGSAADASGAAAPAAAAAAGGTAGAAKAAVSKGGAAPAASSAGGAGDKGAVHGTSGSVGGAAGSGAATASAGTSGGGGGGGSGGGSAPPPSAPLAPVP